MVIQIGVTFPQTELGMDPAIIRDYVQAVEALQYDYLLAYEHVLGANSENSLLARVPYTHKSMFHEPFTLFGYLAGLTQRIILVTGVIILPQRQTVLVAKQAAEIDVLSNGRLVLGIGLGWNPIESVAMNEDFHTRGKRIEEQVDVMRKLWTNQLVTFRGEWHQIEDAGINPLPIQRPIPVWMGGGHDKVLQRIGRIGDGWISNQRPDVQGLEQAKKLRAYTRAAGRNEEDVGISGSISAGLPEEQLIAQFLAWKSLGATHVSLNTMGIGLEDAAGHIRAVERFRETVTNLL